MAARSIYVRLPPREQAALLGRIVERCALGERPSSVRPAAHALASDAGPPVVVFDLDGTLLDNRPRTCAILHEIARRWHAKEPELAAKLAGAAPEALPYHFEDTLEQLGVTRPELAQEASQFWRTRFFSDGDLVHDIEVPGARAFAKACHEAGATVLYLTGRDLPFMGLGTFGSLRDLGFPIGVPGTELVLKPDPAIPDAEFKRNIAGSLGRVGHVVAAFDNEPENCNLMLRLFADADIVFVDTQHFSGAPPLDRSVHVVADLRRPDAH